MIGGRGLAPSRPVEINVLFKSCLIVFISIYLKINKYTYTYIYTHKKGAVEDKRPRKTRAPLDL